MHVVASVVDQHDDHDQPAKQVHRIEALHRLRDTGAR
jgi:hypothetical protein